MIRNGFAPGRRRRRGPVGYAEFLVENGFRVVALGAALGALEHAAKEVPDVVLTDIALPDLNGFELTRALKRDARLATVTVIGLTGHWSSDVSRDASRRRNGRNTAETRGSAAPAR